ncbi:MAG: hypothetical protein GWP27_01135 [Bacteroidetes bacterium]|nr:hypothetical protein [Bacteroidota bacterium]
MMKLSINKANESEWIVEVFSPEHGHFKLSCSGVHFEDVIESLQETSEGVEVNEIHSEDEFRLQQRDKHIIIRLGFFIL